MTQPRYDSRVKVRETEEYSSVDGYWRDVRMMIEASMDALVRIYGKRCFARHEYIILPDGTAFLKGSPNPYIHNPASP